MANRYPLFHNEMTDGEAVGVIRAILTEDLSREDEQRFAEAYELSALTDAHPATTDDPENRFGALMQDIGATIGAHTTKMGLNAIDLYQTVQQDLESGNE